MEPGLKQRLTGAAVIVILAVIFIPMVLDTSVEEKQLMSGTNIPPQPAEMPSPPQAEDFSSRIVPLEQPPEQAPEPAKTPEPEPSAGPAPAVEAPPSSNTAATGEETGEPQAESNEGNADSSVGVTAWVVQLGSFDSEENAEALNQKLRKAGFKAFVEPLKQSDGTKYRVRIGPELKRSDAEAISARLKKDLQIQGIIVHYP